VTPIRELRQPPLGLIRLYAGELALLRGVRLARWMAWAVSIVAVVSMLASLDDGAGAIVTSIEALGWLSWLVGGAVTWSVVRNWKAFQEPLADMARERGVDQSWRSWAAPLALTRHLAVAIGLPALLLTALALALASGATLPWVYPTLLLLVPAYALAFALGLGMLAFLSTKLYPQASTAVLLLLLVLPQVCREVWPYVPSFIDFYEWLWSELLHWGASA